MQSNALFKALQGNGSLGAPSIQSQTPVAAGAGSPSPSPASPLFSALVASNDKPKDDIPDPDPVKAKAFVEGIDKKPDYMQNIKKLLSGNFNG